jgi:hypothetical protein
VRRGALSDATAALPSAAWSARRTPPPLQFSVSLAPDQYLELDDVVVTVRPVAGIGPVLTAGGGTEGWARLESATFGSDVFLIIGPIPRRYMGADRDRHWRRCFHADATPRPVTPARRRRGRAHPHRQ